MGPMRVAMSVALTVVPDAAVMSRCTWLCPGPMLTEVMTGAG